MNHDTLISEHPSNHPGRAMTGLRWIQPLGVCLALSLALSTPAFADHVCQTELALIKTAIGTTDFTNSNDQTKLLYKVEEALLKAHAGKYADAEQKLIDVSTKVKALRDAPKPKIYDDLSTLENEIDVILSRIDDALVCIPNGIAALPH